ncbi:MAG: DUF87 domain-containing protein, partial [Bacilli bacterium]|nr:DUF87 domain-containing protein [Bacilli bacterium]
MKKAKKVLKKNHTKKKKSNILPTTFIPKTNQEIISYMFKEVDERTGIFRIDDDTYSICIEYSDVSFAKANDEEAENIFFKWLEYLHSFREDTHIQVINAGTPIKTEKYKERFIFEKEHLKDERQIQIADELNTLITNSLGTNEDTLQTKRFIVISLKAKNFIEANALFLNIFLKTEQKFKELKSKVNLIPVKERLKFIYNFFNIQSIEDKNIDNIIEYAKENNLTIFDVIAPKKIMMRESDLIEIDDKKFLRVLYVSKLPKSLTPRFYNRITTMEDINIITTLNINPTNSAKMIKVVDKSLSAMETERLEKIKRAGKSNLDYEYVKDKKLETKISNAEQLQYDLQKNNQKIFQNNFLVCITANSFEELEDQTVRVQEVAAEMLIEMKPVLWQQLEGVQNILPLGHNSLQFQRTLTSEATAVNVPFNSKDFNHDKSLFYGVNLVSKNAIFCDRKKLINGNGCVLATSGAGKSFNVKTIIEQILIRYPEDDICIIEPQNEYGELLKVFGGQKIFISTNSNTHINPFDLSLNYGYTENGKSEPVKSKVEYIIAFLESIVGANALSGGQKTIIDRCTKIIFEDYEKSNFNDDSLLPTLPDFYNMLLKQPEEEAKDLALIIERYVKGSMDLFSKKTNIDIQNRLVSFDISQLSALLQTTGYLVVLDHIQNRLAKNKELGKYTWIFIDEFHILLANPYSAQYVANFYKTGRKLNALNTVISQQISHLLRSESGKDILSNSEFALILKQKPLDLPSICNIFNISDEESMYVQGDAPTGQGLVVFGSDVIPFTNKVPKDYLIYQVNNT